MTFYRLLGSNSFSKIIADAFRSWCLVNTHLNVSEQQTDKTSSVSGGDNKMFSNLESNYDLCKHLDSHRTVTEYFVFTKLLLHCVCPLLLITATMVLKEVVISPQHGNDKSGVKYK